MNWLDVIIMASILLSTLLGLKIGLVRAGFMFLAFVLGAFIGAQVASSDYKFLQNSGHVTIADDKVSIALRKKRNLPALLSAIELFQGKPSRLFQGRRLIISGDSRS